MLRLALTLSTLLALAACGSDTGSTDGGTASDAASPTDGGTTDDAGASAARGGPLYTANCTVCHGAQGEGGGTFPPLNTGVVQNQSDSQLTAVIRDGKGRGAMPAFGTTLSGAQIADVVAFIRTLRR